MDRLAESAQKVDWRGLVKSATQKVKKYTLNLTDLELKVEDATSNEVWGPHGSTCTGASGGERQCGKRRHARARARTRARSARSPPSARLLPPAAAAEISEAAFDPENYQQIMGVLARRLQERDERWRMCYKSLLLLEHLVKHGPTKIVGDVQASISGASLPRGAVTRGASRASCSVCAPGVLLTCVRPCAP